ncbi:MAG: DnaA ATPase domain-containing protein [Gemmatimonadaceae bacterium]
MLDGQLRFDNFVVGTANRLAASAARAVAEAPGTVYNPLFVYSNSGLGKTHLLAAIGHQARALHADLVVEYVSLEDFVEQLHLAIASGQAESFKRRYQSVGLLLLDDVQFLSGRPETQSEVLRVFNALQRTGRQIVMASDRAPSEIADVDERLLNRLSGGLIVDMGTPDYETRVAILRHKCAERKTRFGQGVLEELARSSVGNVRELQGALNRLVAHQALMGASLSVGDVWHILGAARLSEEPDEFESFLQDIAAGVAASVDEWRLRLGERVAYWSAQGFRTTILEQALELPEPQNVDQLDASFASVTERLRSLEAEAIRLDARHAGMAVFRDPDRLREAESLVARAAALAESPPAPTPGYDLSALVRTPHNRLALRAAGAVIDAPGTQYNPLFIVGARGSGKTHLANAIGNALTASGSHSRTVACVSGEAFVDDLIASLQQGTIERWRARYRAVDALIIDGLQAIDGKERTQEELFHLFNALHHDNRQIILTSDRPLAAYIGLADRLRTRFDGGLAVTVAAPTAGDRSGRFTPVPEGDEAAAPNIDAAAEGLFAPHEPPPPTPLIPDLSAAVAGRRPLDSFFFDSEKLAAEWPESTGRVVEELV